MTKRITQIALAAAFAITAGGDFNNGRDSEGGNGGGRR